MQVRRNRFPYLTREERETIARVLEDRYGGDAMLLARDVGVSPATIHKVIRTEGTCFRRATVRKFSVLLGGVALEERKQVDPEQSDTVKLMTDTEYSRGWHAAWKQFRNDADQMLDKEFVYHGDEMLQKLADVEYEAGYLKDRLRTLLPVAPPQPVKPPHLNVGEDPDDWGSPMTCPGCHPVVDGNVFGAYDYVHLQGVSINQGGEITRVDSSGTKLQRGAVVGRGSLIEIMMKCENGHDFLLAFQFHKGNVFCWAMLNPKVSGVGEWPDGMWRD